MILYCFLIHIYDIESITIKIEKDDIKIATYEKEKKATSFSEDYIYRFWTDTSFLTLSMDDIILIFLNHAWSLIHH